MPTINATALSDSIGINIHDSYTDTTYAYGGDISPTVTALKKLGVKWVRLGLKKEPQPYVHQMLRDLHTAGISIIGVTGAPFDTDGGFALNQQNLLISAMSGPVYRGLVDIIELPNEQDIFGRQREWPLDTYMYSKSYFNALNSSAVTSSLPVLGPSLAFASNHDAVLKSQYSYQDVWNIHPYAGTAQPESGFLQNIIESSRPLGRRTAYKPVIASEFGYATANLDGAVSEETASRYLIRAFLWNRFHGVSKSLAYELFDEKPDPLGSNIQLHYGLVRVQGPIDSPNSWKQSEKPGFKSLALLLRLLNPGAGAPRAAVHYSIEKSRNVLGSFAVRQSSGEVDIIAWTADGMHGNIIVRPENGVVESVRHLTGADAGALSTPRSSNIEVNQDPVFIRILPD